MKIKTIGASVLAASFLISTVAFAVNVPDQAKTRLQDVKLKSCQARENSIKTRSTNLGRLADGMINHFDQIATRVENYYTNTVVPSGKTVSNYDALVADIQTNKSAVQNALQKASDDVTNFLCTGDDPKGAMIQFKEDMQSVKQALKDYRTSIKNLIVAIRSVVGESASAQSSGETKENKDDSNNQQEENNQQNNQQ